MTEIRCVFARHVVLLALLTMVLATTARAQQLPSGDGVNSPNRVNAPHQVNTPNQVNAPKRAGAVAAANAPDGAELVRHATVKIAQHSTIESRLRVRTDLMGQPLVGSGEYAQLNSSAGLLLRLELSIQAGEQATSVRQISDGRDLWEHWVIGDQQRVNHIDLRRVERTVKALPKGTYVGGTSANLAVGGLPKLVTQLSRTFDFGRAPVRSGQLGGIPVWFATGIWHGELLAKAAPQAVKDGKIVYEKLPVHLPHQVELVLGKDDLFPYRVTYFRYQKIDLEHVLRPAVTTEFFDVVMDKQLNPAQFHYQTPKQLSFVDKTDAFMQAMGIPSNATMATRPEVDRSR